MALSDHIELNNPPSDCVKTIEYFLNNKVFAQLSFDFVTKYCVFVFLRSSYKYYLLHYESYVEAKQVFDFWTNN